MWFGSTNGEVQCRELNLNHNLRFKEYFTNYCLLRRVHLLMFETKYMINEIYLKSMPWRRSNIKKIENNNNWVLRAEQIWEERKGAVRKQKRWCLMLQIDFVTTFAVRKHYGCGRLPSLTGYPPWKPRVRTHLKKTASIIFILSTYKWPVQIRKFHFPLKRHSELCFKL